ncbi:MAG: carboxyl-terminal processing protease [Cyclobacteriaceae bacterium]|jgi:carboxyl-terminal processing protease
MKQTIFTGLVFLILLTGCQDDSLEKQPTAVDNEINEFVWGGLNAWYFWQGAVDDLKDSRFESLDARNQYLNGFNSPDELFENLRHPEDRFSWIVDDYVALQNSFQGINRSYGFEYNLLRLAQDANEIVGYVTYTIAGTNGDLAGIERGELFRHVNGQILTIDNYMQLLNEMTITLAFSSFDGTDFTLNGKEVTVDAQNISENPVLMTKTLEVEGTKVGYLVYNQFIHTRHGELNAAFAALKNDGVSELVLDLRYNPGGAVFTALLLGAMIYDDGTENDIFSRLLYNLKQANQNFNFPFITTVDILDGDFNRISNESMNRLALDRVYILTGRGTASASELIINGLEPYMEVIQIGATTSGKNEGSLTLYDSPSTNYRGQESANPSHLWAMQPIVSRLANAVGFGEYTAGLVPDYELDEVGIFDQLRPLGDPQEQLLKVALDDITGVGNIGRFDYPIREVSWFTPSLEKSKQIRPALLDGLDLPLDLN